ncbi:MAG: hypothetical protein PVJ84_18065 [Desulfobacteraceae bacterium]|jgi:hypothetical protein
MAKKIIPMEKEVTLNGYVEEIDLGNGRSGIIIDNGDDEYVVVMDKIGKKMLDHIDEEVEACGLVTRKDGDLLLKVYRFEPVDYFCDEDYDEGYDFDEYDDYWNA